MSFEKGMKRQFRWIDTDIPTTISHEEMGKQLDVLAKTFIISEIVIKPTTYVRILALSIAEFHEVEA